jgi:hypothetical protein
MLYSEIIAVCSQIHTKHKNTHVGHNVPHSKHTQTHKKKPSPNGFKFK